MTIPVVSDDLIVETVLLAELAEADAAVATAAPDATLLAFAERWQSACRAALESHRGDP